jgi:hypothetical protein
VSRVELDAQDLAAIHAAEVTARDFRVRERLRAIRKRAAMADRFGDLGDAELPNVGRFDDIAKTLTRRPSRTPS